MPWVSVALFVIMAAPSVPAKRTAPRSADRPSPTAQHAPAAKRAQGANEAKSPASARRKAPNQPAAKPLKREDSARAKAAARRAAPSTKKAPKAADKAAPQPRPVVRRKAAGATPGAAKAPKPRARARVPAARPAPPKKRQAKAAPKPRPDARRPAPRSADGKDAKKAPARRAADKSAPKPVLLPFIEDRSVRVLTLNNGLECWCKTIANAKITQLRLGIAAGTATDPKGLEGTARFLAALLDQRLNAPKNPPHSSVPTGGSYYDVVTDKDWVLVKARLRSKLVGEALAHIGNSLKEAPSSIVPQAMRESLQRATAPFPPPAMLERVERFLFRGQPHGRSNRGKSRTFKTIQGLRLQSSWKDLYKAHRMRLLVVGQNDCEQVKEQVQRTLGVLADQKGKKDKIPMFVSSQLQPSGRFFLSRAYLHLYKLPALVRKDFVPLWLLHQIAKREMQRKLDAKYGQVPIHTALQIFTNNSYMLFSLPGHATQKRAINKLVKNALGTLRMQPYPPALKQRITTKYRNQISLQVREASDSSKGAAELLLPQLLLPAGKEKRPQAMIPLIEQSSPKVIRSIARKFMGQHVSTAGSQTAPSLPKILMLIVTIMLIWLLLNQTFRRSRRNDD